MNLPPDERARVLKRAMDAIAVKHGQGSIMYLGSGGRLPEVSAISTGSASLDLALGIGGVPLGRIVEIFGPEASGKTTICLHILAEAQKIGGAVAFIDAEHALDVSYAERVGVRRRDLLVAQPDNGEQAVVVVEKLVGTRAVSALVVDSVASLVPRVELEGQFGEEHPGVHAQLMGQAIRRLSAAIARSQTCLVFTNQIRTYFSGRRGSYQSTPGGLALKYAASQRIEVRRVGDLKVGTGLSGSRTMARVVKNKVAAPSKEVEFDIIYGRGIDREGDLLDAALSAGVVQQEGTWLTFNAERLCEGREATAERLRQQPDLMKLIEDLVYEEVRVKPHATTWPLSGPSKG